MPASRPKSLMSRPLPADMEGEFSVVCAVTAARRRAAGRRRAAIC